MDGELITPRHGRGICPACFNFTLHVSGRCRACEASQSHLAAIVPISYAPAYGALHGELADYKRAAEPAVPDLIDRLASVLSRFLVVHEGCVARAAGVSGFDAVAVVPSSDPRRDAGHPLRRIVGRLVPETQGRYVDALEATGAPMIAHTFYPARFRSVGAVRGASILLIDDMWTTGASAQSAAACLRAAGAQTVAAVVIGRYVNGNWGGISERLAAISSRFDPDDCVICQDRLSGSRRFPPASYTRDSPQGGRSSVG